VKRTLTEITVVLFIIGLIAAALPLFVQTSNAAGNSDWTLVQDGRGVKAYPDLREYVWEKAAAMAPNGPYDKIGLRRLVKTGITPKGVILLCPGTNGNAEQLMSNPPDDTWTKFEENSQPLYWANRGYDVFGIDYRTHFVPISLSLSQLSFMANWGYDQWTSDVKEAVEKTKEVSGAKRIYLAGISFGGNVVMNHAAKYWQQDLKGIILLDAGPGTSNPNPTNTYNLIDALAQMNAKGTWGNEFGAPFTGSIFIMKYSLENPGGPAVIPGTNDPLYPPVNPVTKKPWANITEWGQNYFRSSTSNTNFTGGYGDYWVMTHYFASNDRYWPARLGLERNAWWGWTNCPYVAYDYDDHYAEINVPLLGFTSQNYGAKSWGKVSRGIANPDVTGIFLPYYGHLDVFLGVYCAAAVSEPSYQWILNRKMLVGEGRIDVEDIRHQGDAIVFVNTTTINALVEGRQPSWKITEYIVRNNMEVYNGEGELGRIKINLNNGCIVANGPRVHFQGSLE